MRLEGERRIAAPRERVWAALDDPQVLRRCIPGCESLEREDAAKMSAVATVRIGPVKARFRGTLTLDEVQPPEGLRIRGQGQGGAAGFAQGEANVALVANGDATVLRYAVDTQVGGKLAQIGGRLIDQSARAMAESFFAALDAEIAGPPEEPIAAPTNTVDSEEKPASSLRLAAAIVVAVAVAALAWFVL